MALGGELIDSLRGDAEMLGELSCADCDAMTISHVKMKAYMKLVKSKWFLRSF